MLTTACGLFSSVIPCSAHMGRDEAQHRRARVAHACPGTAPEPRVSSKLVPFPRPHPKLEQRVPVPHHTLLLPCGSTEHPRLCLSLSL